MTLATFNILFAILLGSIGLIALGIKLGDMFVAKKRFEKYTERLENEFTEYAAKVDKLLEYTVDLAKVVARLEQKAEESKRSQ